MPFIYLLISFAVANAVIIYICLTVALIVASLLCIVGCVMDFLFSSCCYFFFFFFFRGDWMVACLSYKNIKACLSPLC